MLDSLVRVSRRVGWMTDLLAASPRPPTVRSPWAGHTNARRPRTSVRRRNASQNDPRGATAPRRRRRNGTPRGPLAMPRSGDAPTGERPAPEVRGPRPPATLASLAVALATTRPAAASSGREEMRPEPSGATTDRGRRNDLRHASAESLRAPGQPD